MNRYEIKAQIGDGSFGQVFQATLKESGSIVAIKQIKKKMHSWTECISLREIQSLRDTNHPNIVSLMEVILESDGSLYFVFEFMPDGSLYELMKRCIETNTRLSNERVASIGLQLLNALSFLHDEKHSFHRDLKPENVLVSGDTIKLADFGLCRDISTNAPFTSYVSTRWYRAPEVILRSNSYGPPIDLWGMGSILVELYSLQPLFPGSSEIDQMKLITELIGPIDDWEEGVDLMQRMKLVLPSSVSSPSRKEAKDEVELRIQRRLPKDVPSSAANLIASMLSWDPRNRPRAKESMQHDIFTSQTTNTNCTSPNDVAEEEAVEEQTQKVLPSTVKRSNLSNERIRKSDDLVDTKGTRRLPFSLMKSEDTHREEDTNEFNDYLAAVSSSSLDSGALPTSASGRTGNRIRPLLFEKENRSFPEERLSSRHDWKYTGYPKSTRKKRNKSNKSHSHRRSGIASTALGRGFQVEISNQRPFVPADSVANIWDKTEETSNLNFDDNEFSFR